VVLPNGAARHRQVRRGRLLHVLPRPLARGGAGRQGLEALPELAGWDGGPRRGPAAGATARATGGRADAGGAAKRSPVADFFTGGWLRRRCRCGGCLSTGSRRDAGGSGSAGRGGTSSGTSSSTSSGTSSGTRGILTLQESSRNEGGEPEGGASARPGSFQLRPHATHFSLMLHFCFCISVGDFTRVVPWN
jgi:hypothetical protein